MTFGQLLIQLEELRKNDPKLLETECQFELAVTLPGRQLFFVEKDEEDADAS